MNCFKSALAVPAAINPIDFCLSCLHIGGDALPGYAQVYLLLPSVGAGELVVLNTPQLPCLLMVFFAPFANVRALRWTEITPF